MRFVLEDPGSHVHLIVCARDASDTDMFYSTPIAIPRLADRVDELLRIVEEYWTDAARDLGLARRAVIAISPRSPSRRCLRRARRARRLGERSSGRTPN